MEIANGTQAQRTVRGPDGVILVTGGAGFIGGHLVAGLSDLGRRVRVLDNFSNGRRLGDVSNSETVEVVQCDILDPESLGPAMRGVDCTVHLAAQANVSRSVADPAGTFETNVQGTVNVLRAGIEAGVRRAVFASTCAVYGDAERMPIREDAPLRPLSPYAESKAMAEAECAKRSGGFERGITVLRFFNVYGPRPNGAEGGGVVDSFAGRIGGGERPIVYGDGGQTRDFVHVADVCRAIEIALSGAAPPGVFNIGTGKETSMVELARRIGVMMGHGRVTPLFEPPRPGEVRRSAADTTKARSEIGFSPRVSMEEGLLSVVGKGVAAT